MTVGSHRSQQRILLVAPMPMPHLEPYLVTLFGRALPLRVVYFMRGSEGRGWGDLAGSYPHAYVARWSPPAGLRGFHEALDSRTSAVVSFGYASAFSVGALMAARLRRLPVFMRSDSSLVCHRSSAPLRRVLKRLVLRVLLSRHTRIWTVGRSNAAFWKHMGFLHQRPIPFECPVPVAPAADSRVLALTRPRVLYVGRLATIKRVPDLFGAVGRLRASGVDCELRVVGEGDLADHLGLEQLPAWVSAPGAVPREGLAAEYSDADVLVLPSDWEPFGLVVREALQFGLPVVTSTAVEASAELCDQGWNRVPVGDVTALANAVRTALGGPRWTPQEPVDITPTLYEELAPTVAAIRPGSHDRIHGTRRP